MGLANLLVTQFVTQNGWFVEETIFHSKYPIDFYEVNGEPRRIRTFDLLIKSQLLYQLSYGPTLFSRQAVRRPAAGPPPKIAK